jgi:environmental stress-induced protein Ves
MALHITDEGGIQQERTIDTLYDDSFSFKGETKIMCSLIDGPLNDFNLMTRREYGTSEVVTVHLEGGNSVKKILSGTHDLIHCLEGPLIVQIQPSDKTVSMEVSDTLHLENRVESESVLIRAPSKRGVAFLITIKKHT